MAKRKKAKKKAGKAKTKAKAKRGGRKAAARESLVVTSKCKAYIKSQGYKSSGDLVDAANAAVYGILDAAMSRAGSNKRSTVRPQDI